MPSDAQFFVRPIERALEFGQIKNYQGLPIHYGEVVGGNKN
jgi:hypothetical protein